MSLKKVETVKADKGFKILDLAVYGVILAVIVALFLSFVAFADRSPLKGIKITYVPEWDAVEVFNYNFETDEKRVLREENILVLKEDNKTLELAFYVTAEDKDYNIIVIDKVNRAVWVREADCPKKDCMNMGKLTDNSRVIQCIHHRAFAISPYGFELSGDKIN